MIFIWILCNDFLPCTWSIICCTFQVGFSSLSLHATSSHWCICVYVPMKARLEPVKWLRAPSQVESSAVVLQALGVLKPPLKPQKTAWAAKLGLTANRLPNIRIGACEMQSIDPISMAIQKKKPVALPLSRAGRSRFSILNSPPRILWESFYSFSIFVLSLLFALSHVTLEPNQAKLLWKR